MKPFDCCLSCRCLSTEKRSGTTRLRSRSAISTRRQCPARTATLTKRWRSAKPPRSSIACPAISSMLARLLCSAANFTAPMRIGKRGSSATGRRWSNFGKSRILCGRPAPPSASRAYMKRMNTGKRRWKRCSPLPRARKTRAMLGSRCTSCVRPRTSSGVGR